MSAGLLAALVLGLLAVLEPIPWLFIGAALLVFAAVGIAMRWRRSLGRQPMSATSIDG